MIKRSVKTTTRGTRGVTPERAPQRVERYSIDIGPMDWVRGLVAYCRVAIRPPHAR